MLQSHLPVANKILASLPRSDYLRLLPTMEVVPLAPGQALCDQGECLNYVYFPTDALMSLLIRLSTQEVFTVGLLGRDGMLGACVATDVPQSPFEAVVLGAGSVLRMPVRVFNQEFRRNAVLRDAVLQFASQLMVQIAENAACNRFHIIEKRLARWLLMVRDRLSSGHFHITHESLAQLLGVRRVGVTNAAQALKQSGLIDYSRGAVDILDSAGLQAVACSCYHPFDGRHGKP